LLNFPQFEAGPAARFVGKVSYSIQAVAEPGYEFDVHDIKTDITVKATLSGSPGAATRLASDYPIEFRASRLTRSALSL
jgi:hypothetical protein